MGSSNRHSSYCLVALLFFVIFLVNFFADRFPYAAAFVAAASVAGVVCLTLRVRRVR